MHERHEREQRLISLAENRGFKSGLTMGLLAGSLALGLSNTLLRPKNVDPLIDCEGGPRNGAINLFVRKNEVFSTRAITGGDQITITGDNPGSLRIEVTENVIVTFSDQRITGGTTINLNPDSTVSLETNGIIMNATGKLSGDSTAVSISTSCKI